MTTQNKGLIYTACPTGMPIPGTHLQIQDRPIDLSATEPPPNGLLTKNHYISFDPYQRGRMRDPWTSKSYSAPYEVNKPITNSAVSTVVKSANAVFGEGDVVTVFMACPTEEYSLLPGEIVTRAVQKLHNPYAIDVKHFVGTLGMAGLTAYSSMQEIAKPKAGETLFVSAASGAVGQLVGQIAKREGMKVVGSVGDEAKLEYILKDLQFDGGFNYKREKPADALGLLAPEGLDVYYDNVGGEQLDAAIQAMKPFGRIVACGMVSQYNLPPSEMYPIRLLTPIVRNRLTVRGFVVGDPDFGPKYREEFGNTVAKWLAEGSLKARTSLTKGMDNAAEGLVGMLQGRNFGKAILVVNEPD